MAVVQVVAFKVGKEEYGVEISVVQEIVRYQEITKIPDTPEFVEGIVNLRGIIIPIIDLKKRFKKEDAGESEQKVIIIVNLNDTLVGLTVDNVSEILRIQEKEIDPPPPIIAGISRKYIKGIAKMDKRLIIILDIEKILSEGEKEQLASLVSNE